MVLHTKNGIVELQSPVALCVVRAGERCTHRRAVLLLPKNAEASEDEGQAEDGGKMGHEDGIWFHYGS